jgi:S1-C subfamily serine protease
MIRSYLVLVLLLPSAAAAQDTDGAPDWQTATAKLQAATVTVRIWGADDKPEAPPASVTVCSGVCVRKDSIVTAAFAGSDSRIRLTHAGGAQIAAKLQLIDEYSGLALLKCDTAGLTPVSAADAAPQVGQELLSAAAWGLEKPLVARAIVGGVDRQHPGLKYPPLLALDALTTETSSGAGLVNRAGQLMGLIVAAEQGRRGWTYAVPVSHLQRILRAADEQPGDGVTILKRRRPVVGMEVVGEEEAVVVRKVTPGGGAEKAGIQVGDEVLATDGVAIRSAYQAVVPTLFKQPGDTTRFRLRRADKEFEATVTLGGGVEVSSAPADLLAGLIQPKVQLTRDARGIVLGPRRGGLGEVAAPVLPDEPPPPPAAPTAAEKVALLEKVIDRYLAAIEIQQRQIADEQKRRQELEAKLQKMQVEIDALRKALSPK